MSKIHQKQNGDHFVQLSKLSINIFRKQVMETWKCVEKQNEDRKLK